MRNDNFRPCPLEFQSGCQLCDLGRVPGCMYQGACARVRVPGCMCQGACARVRPGPRACRCHWLPQDRPPGVPDRRVLVVSTAGNHGSLVLGGWSRPPQGRGLYRMEAMESGSTLPPAQSSASDTSGARRREDSCPGWVLARPWEGPTL